MIFDSAGKWIIAFAFGFAMVGLYSWSRFDEPSYDSQSEYFSRYKPRFSTSYARYARAKWAYSGAMILIYAVFSLVPELFTAIVSMGTDGSQRKTADGLVPLGAALGLVTLQNVPGLKELERRIRGFLHSVARIPDCVRRTVAQMRGSRFTFEQSVYECQTRKLVSQLDSNKQQSAGLTKLIDEDEILHTWYCVGSVLTALSERKRANVGIDPIFFAYYKEELDSIAAKHVALIELVREHLSECLRGNAPADLGTLGEIYNLRDRLYTFVACGVHSTVNDDADSLDVVRKLGFNITDEPLKVRLHVIGPLAGLSVICIAVLSIFTAYSTQVFSEYVLLRVGRTWIEAFRVPTTTLGLFTWSWTTAIFYFTTIFGAIGIRNLKISRCEWFDINELRRERPLLRYVTPILVGSSLGALTLSIIAIIGGPGFNASFGEAGAAVADSLPWFPLATVMAFIVILLSDSQLKDDRFWRSIVFRALVGAVIMTLVGFLTSRLSISISLADHAAKRQLELTREVLWTGIYTSLFIAVQIGLLAFVFCIIAQVAEYFVTRAPSCAGNHVELITGEGTTFSIFLDQSGEASQVAANAEVSNIETVSCRGQWQVFPEGTAMKWSASSGESPSKIGDFGLIRRSGDSVVYEGYAGQFSWKKKPVFDARADVRVNNDGAAFNRIRESGKMNGVLATSSLHPSSKQAVATVSVIEEMRP